MKCIICKKEADQLQTTWDKIRLFFFHFFHEDIIDLSSDQYTKGFGEGYAAGYKQAMHQKFDSIQSVGTLEDILKRWQK